MAIPDWINFKNISSVEFRVLYRDTFSLFTKDAQKRAKHARAISEEGAPRILIRTPLYYPLPKRASKSFSSVSSGHF